MRSGLSETGYALLGILAECGPSSGYDLRQFISGSIAFFWNASFSRIYQLLRRLESEGYVSARQVEQTHRPDKLVYSLTESGRAAFVRWLRQPVEPGVIRDPFLLRVFFFQSLSPKERRPLIATERARHEERLATYRRIEAHADERLEEAFEYETLRFGIAYERAYLEWLDGLERLANARHVDERVTGRGPGATTPTGETE